MFHLTLNALTIPSEVSNEHIPAHPAAYCSLLLPDNIMHDVYRSV